MGRFELARAKSAGIILPTQDDLDEVAPPKSDFPKKSSLLNVTNTNLYNPNIVRIKADSALERNLVYEGNGTLSDGQRLFDLDPEDYKTFEKKAELCALIAQIEKPNDIIVHAAYLMTDSVDDLITRYNKARGYFRGINTNEKL